MCMCHQSLYIKCCGVCVVQEEEEVPDDEQLNDMIARNEEEMEIFTVSVM